MVGILSCIKVIHKVSWLWGKFDPDMARNQYKGLNFLQTKLKRSTIGFCTDFGAKISFIPNRSLFLSACITVVTFLLL
jgi:hypothetical protein